VKYNESIGFVRHDDILKDFFEFEGKKYDAYVFECSRDRWLSFTRPKLLKSVDTLYKQNLRIYGAMRTDA
jgi:hypothetical protein